MRMKKATLTPLNGDPYNEAHARGLFHAHAREEGHAHVRVSIARARPQLAKVPPGHLPGESIWGRKGRGQTISQH